MLQLWDKKILDVRGTSFQRKRLRNVDETRTQISIFARVYHDISLLSEQKRFDYARLLNFTAHEFCRMC